MASIVPRIPKAIWTKAADKKLIEEMLVQCQKGKKLDNRFKKEAWQEIMIEFNKEMGDEIRSMKQLKNRANIMKQKWKVFNHLLNSSGFEWNNTSEIVTAAESIWTNYLKSNPEAAEFKYRVFENYDALTKIFSNISAASIAAVTPASSQIPIGRSQTSSSQNIPSEHKSIEVPDWYKDNPFSSINNYNEQIDPKLHRGSSLFQPEAAALASQILVAEIDIENNPAEQIISSDSGDEYQPESSPAIQRQSLRPTSRKRKFESLVKGQEAQKLTNFTERISSKLSDLIAEIRASKYVHQAVTDDSSFIPASISLIEAPEDEFKEYRAALAILIEMYKSEVIIKDTVRDAIRVLEKNPIKCVTFKMITEDLRVAWLKDIIMSKQECT
ncbi:unnamed protein product [Tuber aestivum]|uniref:Myb/SANT-like domain-containing protein n=1 Tax=Tuber aestivum TaxID=59557 RepID=A0A292Q4W4_9PEZI|nr:unnamed protein product [Tuber aestivum]